MKHETQNFTIKNVVLLSAMNAHKPCNKSEEFKLYKLWVAAKKDILSKSQNPIRNQGLIGYEYSGGRSVYITASD